MIEQVVKDYAAYFKLDLTNNFSTVQDVIDNMITRLEELTSVVLMIKSKNNSCNSTVTEDLCKYRNEIGLLSRKITILCDVILKLQTNVESIEKQVEKAENDFGVHNDGKIKSFLKPFFNRNKDATYNQSTQRSYEKLTFSTVMDNFNNDKA